MVILFLKYLSKRDTDFTATMDKIVDRVNETNEKNGQIIEDNTRALGSIQELLREKRHG